MFVAVGGTTLVLSKAALCRLNDASLEIPDGPGVEPRDIRLGVAERPEGPGVEGARELAREIDLRGVSSREEGGMIDQPNIAVTTAVLEGSPKRSGAETKPAVDIDSLVVICCGSSSAEKYVSCSLMGFKIPSRTWSCAAV